MNKQPLFVVLISYILGIVFQEIFAFSWRYALMVLVMGGGLLLGILYFKKVFIRYRSYGLIGFFFSLGTFCHFLNTRPSGPSQLPRQDTFIFYLNKKLNTAKENKRYEVTSIYGNESFPLILSVPKSQEDLDFKHFYQAELYVNRVQQPLNDYSFDYAQYLARQGIYWQALAFSDIRKFSVQRQGWESFFKQKRLDLLGNIETSGLQKTSVDFLKGVVLADRTEMDRGMVVNFQKSGLAHILAISGTHIGIIFGFFYFVFSHAIPLKLRRYAILLSLLSIWFFAFFIGFGNSVVRACIMLSSYFGFRIYQRKTDVLHALSVAGLLILGIDTQQFFNVGFQLSFAAVLGIFGLNRPFRNCLPHPRSSFQNVLTNVVSVTLSAQLATLPLVLYYFHQFSLLSFGANLLLILLFEVMILFSFVLVFLMVFGLEDIRVYHWYEIAMEQLLNVVNAFSRVDWGFSDRLSFSFGELILAFLLLYVFRFFLVQKNLKYGIYLGFCILLLWITKAILNFQSENQEEAMVHYTFNTACFSVKKGDEVVFYIKANDDPQALESHLIKPYLNSRRANHYRVIVLPHDTKEIRWKGKVFLLSSLNAKR